ncbi:MAG: hypothetical protein R3E86_15575 [Pseudomonadales bacterium]
MSWILYTAALACGCGAALLVLFGFIEWLQTSRWPALSLLQAAYDLRLLRARWFLANEWTWPLHDVLAQIPVSLSLLALAPLFWWVATRLAHR